MIAELIVIVASVLAALALFLLAGSKVNENKKHQILIAMGSLLLLAITISYFKYHSVFTFSLINNGMGYQNPLFNKIKPYSTQLSFQSDKIGDTILYRNFKNVLELNQRQMAVVYSSKSQGASHCMHSLASKLIQKGKLVLYIKIQFLLVSTRQFYRKIGLNSFEQFKHNFEVEKQSGNKFYIIIDNAQLLSKDIWDYFSRKSHEEMFNFIINTQNTDLLLEMISETKQPELIHKFQWQRFVGATSEELSNLVESRYFPTNLPATFQVASLIKNGIMESEILMKISSAYNIVANHYGLSLYLNQLKKAKDRSLLLLGQMKKLNIPLEELQRMEILGLVSYKNGEIIIK